MSKEKHLCVKISQSMLLEYEKRILLLKHLSGAWILPGGRLNIQEKWIDGLRREIYEETGIEKVNVIRILGVDNWEENGEYHYGIFVYGTTESKKIRLGKEHVDFSWVSRKDISRYKFWNKELKERVIRFAQIIY